MNVWIKFEDAGTTASGKTCIWNVVAKDGDKKLGEVYWYGPWRKYIFEPAPYTIFEEDCLRYISDFIEDQTRQHRAASKAKRKERAT